MAYEIETGVEMPVKRTWSRYPWDEIAVNQSFFIEGKMKKLIIPRRLKQRKFEQAVMPKNGIGSPMGLRIKRTA